MGILGFCAVRCVREAGSLMASQDQNDNRRWINAKLYPRFQYKVVPRCFQRNPGGLTGGG